MTAKRTREIVAETVRYCWLHTDDAREEEIMRWVAEKLAIALGDVYCLPNGKREILIDGPAQAITNRARSEAS